MSEEKKRKKEHKVIDGVKYYRLEGDEEWIKL